MALFGSRSIAFGDVSGLASRFLEIGVRPDDFGAPLDAAFEPFIRIVCPEAQRLTRENAVHESALSDMPDIRHAISRADDSNCHWMSLRFASAQIAAA